MNNLLILLFFIDYLSLMGNTTSSGSQNEPIFTKTTDAPKDQTPLIIGLIVAIICICCSCVAAIFMMNSSKK